MHTVAALCLLACPAIAVAEGATLRVDLNAAEQVDSACRLIFTTRNETGTAIDKLVYETVLIGSDGAVQRLTLFDFRDAPAGKLRVRQFDVPATDCAALGQVLFNGVSSCVVGGAENPVCAEASDMSSRVSIEVLQ
ncbi:hypothetical protein [Actibacterium sp. D379-3]